MPCKIDSNNVKPVYIDTHISCRKSPSARVIFVQMIKHKTSLQPKFHIQKPV